MKSYYGKSFNLMEPLLCKIVLQSSGVSGTNTACLCSSGWFSDVQRYSAVILDSSALVHNSISIPIFQFSQNGTPIEEGDVVLIEPSGLLTVLYKKQSLTNSVLLTERCNCRCLMCPQPPRNGSEDWIDLSLRTIALMDSNTQALGITGGEPTLVWDGLIKVLSACHDFIPRASVHLLTNGRILKDYDKAEELAEVGGKNLFVGVPLYADISDIHDTLLRSKGAFWDTVEGLYNLERAGIFVELRTVITKQNYMRLPQWAEYVFRTMPFVGRVVFMGLEPIGLALENIDQLWIDPADYLPQLEQAIKILHRRDMPVLIYNHQLCTLPTYLWPIAVKSISDWKIVYMPECDGCSVKASCGGFFFSAQLYKSRNICPVPFVEL